MWVLSECGNCSAAACVNALGALYIQINYFVGSEDSQCSSNAADFSTAVAHLS
jgi:hypothetical protein